MVFRNGIKIFVVSDATKFALTDVYQGYIHALRQLKIPYETFPYHHLRDIISDITCFHIVHSMALMKNKGFTHVMFVGGLNVPSIILESMYDKKKVVIATEDPHSFDPNKLRLDMVDYYFTNEKSIGNSGKYKNVYYCPTGASAEECGKLPEQIIEDRFKSDILFLGAVYPNRRKLFETILPFVKKHGLTFKICGHVRYMPKKSPLWEYVEVNGTVPHSDTVKYYNGAKVVLNVLRDIKWNPRSKSQKNPYNRSRFKAESLNPRAYEVPLCQAFMLLEDSRPECREVFTEKEVGFFSNEEDLTKKLRYYLIGAGKNKREQMAFEAYKKVATQHTYVHRLQLIMDTIQKSEA